MEVWKDIKGYEGYYQISNKGRVKSLIGWNGKRYVKREKILKNSVNKTQLKNVVYAREHIKLSKDKTTKTFRIHRLVAEAFIPNPNNYKVINHIDSNALNNNVENLEWCTQSHNMQHAYKHGNRNTFKITKEELIDLYCLREMTMQQIADKFSVTREMVRHRMKKFKIKRRTAAEYQNKYNLSKNFLYQELVLNGKKQYELATEIGCDASNISHFIKKLKEKGEWTL